ncbi:MAG: hypothetical protein APR63_11465 [Desulfuromonas sp. SDB]|nr:MAG: hypothetical protein APR63_11465 [Desulfuromonas sp. SDB]
MLRSLRSFGGEISKIPVIIFVPENSLPDEIYENFTPVKVFKIEPANFKFFFQLKVKAAAQSEKLCGKDSGSLIWLSSNCLILKPPLDFILDNQFHAAFRPVHIKNIGLSSSQPVDGFWNEIYRRVGVSEIGYEVTSLLGNENLRPYFNTHWFSINSKLGILNKWEQIFVELINDNIFIENHCNDQQHQIFLHQAILSALITKYIPREKLRILDAGYSYPLHFQDKLKTHDLFKSLEEMV